jgi:glycerol-3-phosphate dehydrogenase (NAD(P)+)
MRTTVGILGAGEIGQALSIVLQKNREAEIFLWDIDPIRVPGQKSLQEIVQSADVLFFCMNSWHVRQAIKSVKEKQVNSKKAPPFIPVFLAKGVEEKSWYTMDQLIEDAWPEAESYCIMGGPMLAEEISRGQFGAAVVGSIDQTAYARLEDLFKQTSIHLEYTYDVRGVSLAGVLKNIYSILVGMMVADYVGSNLQGLIVQRIIQEMKEIGEFLGARQQTIMGVAGVGDFMATSSSDGSLNRQAGMLLINENKVDKRAEGISSVGSLTKLLDAQSSNSFPLLHMIDDAVDNPAQARRIMREFFERL